MDKKPLHPTIKALHAEIVAYLERSSMDRTRFGKLAVRDGNFLPRIESGRIPTLTTLDRVRAFLDKNGKAAKPWKRPAK
jgi:hypothetical protein